MGQYQLILSDGGDPDLLYVLERLAAIELHSRQLAACEICPSAQRGRTLRASLRLFPG
jgi:hypothetical protein